MNLYKQNLGSDGKFSGLRKMNSADLNNLYDYVLTLWKNNYSYGKISSSSSGLGSFKTITFRDTQNRDSSTGTLSGSAGSTYNIDRPIYISTQDPGSYDNKKFPVFRDNSGKFVDLSFEKDLFNNIINRWKDSGINWQSETPHSGKGNWVSETIYTDYRRYPDTYNQQKIWRRTDSVSMTNKIFYYDSSEKKYKTFSTNDFLELTKHFVSKLKENDIASVFESTTLYDNATNKSIFTGKDYKQVMSCSWGWQGHPTTSNSYWYNSNLPGAIATWWGGYPHAVHRGYQYCSYSLYTLEFANIGGNKYKVLHCAVVCFHFRRAWRGGVHWVHCSCYDLRLSTVNCYNHPTYWYWYVADAAQHQSTKYLNLVVKLL